jgi:hypothetical protein
MIQRLWRTRIQPRTRPLDAGIVRGRILLDQMSPSMQRNMPQGDRLRQHARADVVAEIAWIGGSA